jgi:glyoxylase-like metal-dependent hydrolase (beta-lactamase superfamily II)
MLHVATFRFNDYYENTYLAYDNAGECMLIDPGMYTTEERNAIDSYIASLQLNIKYIALTHAHLDHILGLSYAMHTYNCPLLVHPAEHRNLPLLKNYGISQGYTMNDIPNNVLFIQENDVVQVGSQTFHVWHTPGHTQNSISLYNEQAGKIFSGDILYSNAIGNTWLPGGNLEQLINTIETKMLSLPPHTNFFPGHGATTSIHAINQTIQKGYFKGLGLEQAI